MRPATRGAGNTWVIPGAIFPFHRIAGSSPGGIRHGIRLRAGDDPAHPTTVSPEHHGWPRGVHSLAPGMATVADRPYQSCHGRTARRSRIGGEVDGGGRQLGVQRARPVDLEHTVVHPRLL